MTGNVIFSPFPAEDGYYQCEGHEQGDERRRALRRGVDDRVGRGDFRRNCGDRGVNCQYRSRAFCR